MQTIGTFFELGSSSAVEALSRTGLDYIIIDTEHGYATEDSVVEYIRAAENGGLMPYVRIGDIRRPYVLRMLDIGARGLIVPNIRSVDEVKQLVSAAKFPPIGNRGYCPTRTTVWGMDEWSKDVFSYMEECNRRVKLLPQCETKEALECIEEIVSLDGVDGVFIGPCDLSISLGVPLQFDSPVLLAAIERIYNACHAAGKEVVIFAGNIPDVKKWLAKGFDSVAYSLDAAIFANAMKAAVEECRN